jgi:hypothetical protein
MFLLVASDGSNEWRFPAPASEVRLGSAMDNDLVVPVRGVSRHHAIVRRIQGGVEIVDLHSKNGLTIAGKRVDRAFLTPGLGLHLGIVWLEFQELSSTEELLADMASGHPPAPGEPSRVTEEKMIGASTHGPESSPEAALSFAFHLQRIGVGATGERLALLTQARSVLGARALITVYREGRTGLSVLESSGAPPEADLRAVCAAIKSKRGWSDSEVRIKGFEQVLVAGCLPWFLGAIFADAAAAAVHWRRDLMRILGEAFFSPIRRVRELADAEVDRALELAKGNKARAARELGLSRQAIYDHLRERESKAVLSRPPKS